MMLSWRHTFCLVGGLIYGFSAQLWPAGNPFVSVVTAVTYFLGLFGVCAIAMLLGVYVERRVKK